MKRSLQTFLRNPLMMRFMVINKLLFIFIFLTAFWQNAGENSATAVNDRAGFLVFFLVFNCFSAVSSMGGYYDEKGQYVREQASHTYSPLSYYLSKMLSEVPLELALLVIYMTIIYAGVGLSFDHAEQILIFILICMLIYVTGKGWCFTFLFAFDTVHIAAAVTPFVVTIQFLFAGFFINYNNVPYYLYEILYFSIFKYTWSAAMINEFDSFDMAACRSEAIPELRPQCDPISSYNIEMTLWGNIAVAAGHTVLVNVLAYVALQRVSKKFRS